jgi:hypothetical protein
MYIVCLIYEYNCMRKIYENLCMFCKRPWSNRMVSYSFVALSGSKFESSTGQNFVRSLKVDTPWVEPCTLVTPTWYVRPDIENRLSACVKIAAWHVTGILTYPEHSLARRHSRGDTSLNQTHVKYSPESVATLPPFSPIEGQKWFDQISSQWESQKNRFALIYFGKIQFLLPCIWNLPFMSTASERYLMELCRKA